MENNQKCPIWGTEAEINRDESGGNGAGASNVSSPRAGGKFYITDIVSGPLGNSEEQLKIKITSWILQQNKFGNVPAITQKIIEEANSWPKSKVWDRADNLLRYIDSKTEWLGDTVIFKEPGTDADTITKHELMAWTGSYKFAEVMILTESIKGWVEFRTGPRQINNGGLDPDYGVYSFSLLPSGFKKLAELESANPESSQVFVAMWFDSSMQEAYEEGLKPAIEDVGFEPIRIDGVEHANKIDDEIIAAIRRARFVVADFTSESDKPRGGVYFEAGFALGLNIPVIWTCHKDMIDKVHFDTRQYNHITWEDPQELRTKLRNRISAIIGDGPDKIPKKTKQ